MSKADPLADAFGAIADAATRLQGAVTAGLEAMHAQDAKTLRQDLLAGALAAQETATAMLSAAALLTPENA